MPLIVTWNWIQLVCMPLLGSGSYWRGLLPTGWLHTSLEEALVPIPCGQKGSSEYCCYFWALCTWYLKLGSRVKATKSRLARYTVLSQQQRYRLWAQIGGDRTQWYGLVVMGVSVQGTRGCTSGFQSICMCMWKFETELGVFLHISQPYIFETGSLTEPGVHWLARLAGQKLLGIHWPLLPQHGGSRLCHHGQYFRHVMGIWACIMFTWQVLYALPSGWGSSFTLGGFQFLFHSGYIVY